MNTLVTAHTGADGTADNSLAFVRYALTSGADALEVDVRRTEDGTLRLGHDAADENAPALQQVLEMAAAQPSMRVNCDLKQPGLELDVWRLAAACGMAGRTIFSGTVDVDVLTCTPALRQEVEIYLNMEAYIPQLYARWRMHPQEFPLFAAEAMQQLCEEYHIGVVNLYYKLAAVPLVEKLAAAGVGVSAWTADEPDDVAKLLQRGVRNITTRRVGQALALRRAASE